MVEVSQFNRSVRNVVDLRTERAKAIYNEDEALTIRKSHKTQE